MNINLSVICDSCGERTNCRIGMSNRAEQPLRFVCKDCSQPIDIIIGPESFEFSGATQIIDDKPFDEETNFVDLHLDFPVYFEKYEMGMTPFMRASMRIDQQAMAIHNMRLRYLDEHSGSDKTLAVLSKHYMRAKLTPFRLISAKAFDVELTSEAPEDVNAALYSVLAKAMWPFSYPGENENSVDLFMKTIHQTSQTSRTPLESFIKEMIESKFLNSLQTDCLSIYPKILRAELPFRPVLFLDFDYEYHANPIPMRISTDDFENFKDLYKDICEIISRQFILVAGVNNLLKRSDHNTFLPGIGHPAGGRDYTPSSLDAFADVSFGNKLNFIDDNWYGLMDDSANNQIRNAIAHYKTEYDDVTQVVTYYPKLEGIERKTARTISFLEFMRHCLIAYREMHRLHHLIKALFYYKFLLLEKEQPGAD